MKKTLVILTLNEIEGVRALFDKIPFGEADESFVVDGGSADGTIEFFKKKGMRVIVQEIKGRGEAFRIAFREAQGENVVLFSPDGNENPRDIPRLFNLLDEGYDMAIASRFMKGARNEENGKLFPWRAWANRAFTAIANFIWRGKITDSINGYRAIKRGAFKKIKPDAPGFVIEYQISIRAMKIGLKVAELPTQEGERIGGESTARSLPTGLVFLKFLWREIMIGNKFMDSDEK